MRVSGSDTVICNGVGAILEDNCIEALGFEAIRAGEALEAIIDSGATVGESS